MAPVYASEAEIGGLSAEQRLAARRTRTAPLMEVMKARLTTMLDQLFSQSKLAEAINYTLGLTLFLRDGRVEGRQQHRRAFNAPDCNGKA
jgi:hypothetical protein